MLLWLFDRYFFYFYAIQYLEAMLIHGILEECLPLYFHSDSNSFVGFPYRNQELLVNIFVSSLCYRNRCKDFLKQTRYDSDNLVGSRKEHITQSENRLVMNGNSTSKCINKRFMILKPLTNHKTFFCDIVAKAFLVFR